MSVYIYEYIDRVTTNWHNGGAVVIVTGRNPQDAWHDYLLGIADADESNAAYLEDESIIQVLPEPTRTVSTMGAGTEAVYVFPDAGCC